MPELPEVETIRRMLAPDIVGRRITAVTARKPRMLSGIGARNLSASSVGQVIVSLTRRGKYLILELTRDTVILHLGMTGQLVYSSIGETGASGYKRTLTGLQVSLGSNPPDKHTHFIFFLEGGGELRFRDIRTFGKMIYVQGKCWEVHPRIAKLGPEPLELNISRFIDRALPISFRRSVKSVLLDQSFVCGIGNIYCDEALFAAGINPVLRADRITADSWKKLLSSVKKVLRKGIKNSGTTFSDYRRPDGTRGSNQDRLNVYGRAGLECPQCGGILEKTVVAQRGTVYCPVCQNI